MHVLDEVVLLDVLVPIRLVLPYVGKKFLRHRGVQHDWRLLPTIGESAADLVLTEKHHHAAGSLPLSQP